MILRRATLSTGLALPTSALRRMEKSKRKKEKREERRKVDKRENKSEKRERGEKREEVKKEREKGKEKEKEREGKGRGRERERRKPLGLSHFTLQEGFKNEEPFDSYCSLADAHHHVPASPLT